MMKRLFGLLALALAWSGSGAAVFAQGGSLTMNTPYVMSTGDTYGWLKGALSLNPGVGGCGNAFGNGGWQIDFSTSDNGIYHGTIRVASGNFGGTLQDGQPNPPPDGPGCVIDAAFGTPSVFFNTGIPSNLESYMIQGQAWPGEYQTTIGFLANDGESNTQVQPFHFDPTASEGEVSIRFYNSTKYTVQLFAFQIWNTNTAYWGYFDQQPMNLAPGQVWSPGVWKLVGGNYVLKTGVNGYGYYNSYAFQVDTGAIDSYTYAITNAGGTGDGTVTLVSQNLWASPSPSPTPSPSASPGSGGSSANDPVNQSSFWTNLFVPDQAHVDSLHSAWNQLAGWGPFSQWAATSTELASGDTACGLTVGGSTNPDCAPVISLSTNLCAGADPTGATSCAPGSNGYTLDLRPTHVDSTGTTVGSPLGDWLSWLRTIILGPVVLLGAAFALFRAIRPKPNA